MKALRSACSGPDVKQREARQKIMMAAQMRWDGRWLPASIRDISAKGVMMSMPDPPKAGTYVEVQVGSVTLVARTIWTKGQSFGLQLRETLDLSAIKGERGSAVIRTAPRPAAGLAAQNIQTTLNYRHEQSRWFASAIQYVTFVAIAVSAAGGLAWEVYQTISAPVVAIEAALKPNGRGQISILGAES